MQAWCARYGTFVRAGAALLISTGIGMLILSKDMWWQQCWFKIKMGLVALLILNGMLIGNKQGSKFRKIIADYGPDFVVHVKQVKSTLNNFYLIQLLIFNFPAG